MKNFPINGSGKSAVSPGINVQDNQFRNWYKNTVESLVEYSCY